MGAQPARQRFRPDDQRFYVSLPSPEVVLGEARVSHPPRLSIGEDSSRSSHLTSKHKGRLTSIDKSSYFLPHHKLLHSFPTSLKDPPPYIPEPDYSLPYSPSEETILWSNARRFRGLEVDPGSPDLEATVPRGYQLEPGVHKYGALEFRSSVVPIRSMKEALKPPVSQIIEEIRQKTEEDRRWREELRAESSLPPSLQAREDKEARQVYREIMQVVQANSTSSLTSHR